MSSINLLYKTEYEVTPKIKVRIPTVGEVIDNEDDYYNIISIFTAMPIDYMVMLDDNGINFEEITAFELFLLMFGTVQRLDTSLVFGDLDFSKFVLAENNDTKLPELIDIENDIVIDRRTHELIATTLRTIHNISKDNRKPANGEAKRYMLERARKKEARNRKRKKVSQVEQLIIAMVNTQQYKYNFEQTRDLTIYQFNESVKQVIKKVDYESRMFGVYSGTVDVKSLKKDDLNWLVHK